MAARLVIDASVAAKWAFPEVDSDRALRLLDGFQRGTYDLIAPDLFVVELANIAWKKSVLRGEVEIEEAALALRLLLGSRPELFPSEPLVERALALATVHRRPIYDCLYVALALEEGCDFVTADGTLVAALQRTLPGVIGLGALFP